MDEPSVKWSKDRYNEIRDTLRPFLKNCGFNVDKDVYWIPISGINGDNIKVPVGKVCPWYVGPTLI